MNEFNFNEVFENLMKEHDLDTVIILGHMNPDGDAAGSVMGLAHYIKDVYPEYKVLPHLALTLDKGPKKMVVIDHEFDPFTVPQPEAERYMVIVCDTATRARIIGYDLFEKAEVSLLMDHHASNEGYADVSYVKISEACSENVFNALDWERWENIKKSAGKEKIHPAAPDYFYLGIIHDTGGFNRADAGIFAAASRLLALGVDHWEIMQTKQTDTLESLNKRAYLLNQAKRVINENAAYVFLDRKQSLEAGIGYEDIHPISEILRDCEDLKMGFTMYEEEENLWRCSFRSDGRWINVNELAGVFGGGGHAAASGLRIKTEKPEQLLQEIIKEIQERTRI